MSKHVHVMVDMVVDVDMDVQQIMVWTDNDIVQCWQRFHKVTLLTEIFAIETP